MLTIGQKTMVSRLEAWAYSIPTDFPESDGTLEWDKTICVVVEVEADGRTGVGMTYADAATAMLIKHSLAPVVCGQDAMANQAIWSGMVAAVRNLGAVGTAAMAISAVDNALWDLKARLLDLPLVSLLGEVRAGVEVYGSGGFTSYSIEQLQNQLLGWRKQGIACVKMKVGRHPQDDLTRVKAAQEAIGRGSLFIDANGAYTVKQALLFARECREYQVRWFEEPVVAQDLEGLAMVRHRCPEGMDVSAGEYGYGLDYFHHMLEADSVDVLQADATRCLGTTGFLQVAALCEAHHVPLSSHTAPSMHAHPCCAAKSVCHMEYFHDHVRIEHMLFDGVLLPQDGRLYPDKDRPGNGLLFKKDSAERFLTEP